MIEAITVKAACNGILRSIYPDMKIYGPDTTEALERPAFYTELVPYFIEHETINLVKQRMGFKISLMEDVTSEEFELTALAAIRKAFGLKIPIEGRKITVDGIEFEYTGSKNDVFQITITFEWIDTIAEADTHDPIGEIHIRETLNNDN